MTDYHRRKHEICNGDGFCLSPARRYPACKHPFGPVLVEFMKKEATVLYEKCFGHALRSMDHLFGSQGAAKHTKVVLTGASFFNTRVRKEAEAAIHAAGFNCPQWPPEFQPGNNK